MCLLFLWSVTKRKHALSWSVWGAEIAETRTRDWLDTALMTDVWSTIWACTHKHTCTHSHRDSWGPYEQLWTVPEPQLEGGDGERERRMACGVVFCLLSVRAVPSVKKKEGRPHQGCLSRRKDSSTNPFCKLQNKPSHSCRLAQRCTVLWAGRHVWKESLYQSKKRESRTVWDMTASHIHTHQTTLRLCENWCGQCKKSNKHECRGSETSDGRLEVNFLPVNWEQSGGCTSYSGPPVSTVSPPCLWTYQLASSRAENIHKRPLGSVSHSYPAGTRERKFILTASCYNQRVKHCVKVALLIQKQDQSLREKPTEVVWMTAPAAL